MEASLLAQQRSILGLDSVTLLCHVVGMDDRHAAVL